MLQLIREISEGEMQRIAWGASRQPEDVPGAAAIGDALLLAPIPEPSQDIICLGINYMAHAEESARYKKETFDGQRPYAVYFSKRVNQAVNPGQPILSHSDIVDSLDYEAELAVSFLPMGPSIVTADSLPYPPQLSIQSLVNGELRQDSNTRLLIFGIDHVISELSQGMTLKAGTIISMGTPSGVGMGFDPPKFLKPGDVVECRIEGIGSLKNPVE